ncbi:MAG TPA: CopD family protein [Gemmatimonadaceae bacterium]|nr:CopD family protein [Gemmatimonadaceae bacterium]
MTSLTSQRFASMMHRVRAIGIGFRRTCLAAAVLLAMPAPALAHAHLLKTAPASGATIRIAPTQLVLTFSEAPTLAVSTLRLLGPDSAPVSLGTLTHDAGANTLAASITGALRAGRYTVLWQTAGDDGHVQHGSYSFVIAEGSAGLTPLAAATSDATHRDSLRAEAPAAAARRDSVVAPMQPAGFDVSSPLYVLVRWVQFAALLLLVGAVAFRWWILPRAGTALDDDGRRALAAGTASAGLWASLLLGLTMLARLVAQVATMRGLAGPSPTLDAMLIGTVWGHGWLLEVIALIVANFALRLARRDPTSVTAWRTIATAVAALAFVPGYSGHAVAERTFAPFTILFDAAHVLAGGAWLGGLAVIVGVGLPVLRRATAAGRHAAAATMVNAFSPVALTSAAILVVTGVVAAVLHVRSFAALTSTAYGEALLVKLAVVLLLVAVGAWNWRRARPRLATDPGEGTASLARSARLELALALVVLLVTAVLVALPTPFSLS